ncbi:hypothetical protein LTR84_007326 [Exophiala bonariae]|uniref:Uncharacterized protein n=1 Tax=Exophiala bonariae TaxID=1690606 RepID=A0AAV9MXY4_9EURO|nr:hypothetical protein LTR84_007326 [Exophiala bonariae]
MLSLTLRLIAITSGLFGIIFCAQISASIFTNLKSHKDPDLDQTTMTYIQPHPHQYPSPESHSISHSPTRPALRIDTSFIIPGTTTQQPIVEIFPYAPPTRRPSASASAAAFMDTLSKQVARFMVGVLGAVDDISSESSRRAARMQRRFMVPRNRWAATHTHVECSV